MPNIDRSYGFEPVDWNGACKFVRPYEVASNAGAIAEGDAVAAEQDASTAYGVVDRAAAGSGYIVGVAMWFEWKDSYGIQRWGSYYDAATGDTDRIAFVVDDPRVRFRLQSRDDATASQLTHIFSNADHLDTAPTQTGPYSGFSNHELDLNTLTQSAGATCRIENRWPSSANAFGTSTTNNLHGEYIVRIGEHFRGPIVSISDSGAKQMLIPLPAV